jgi:hypothetical protein
LILHPAYPNDVKPEKEKMQEGELYDSLNAQLSKEKLKACVLVKVLNHSLWNMVQLVCIFVAGSAIWRFFIGG